MNQDRHTRIAIFVNEKAAHGRGKTRWQRIKADVLDRLPNDTLVEAFPHGNTLPGRLSELVAREKVDCFISAGGDGSMNVLLNAIFGQDAFDPASIRLGAIGLGSSNDFHKPVRDSIAGIPVRIQYQSSIQADVGLVRVGLNGTFDRRRYFVVNASLGVTAEANALFNRSDAILDRIKGRCTHTAILYAALKTFLTFRNFPVILECDREHRDIVLSNLAAVKIPYVSGAFSYPSIVDTDDGRLGLFYCEDLGRLELIRTLNGLRKGNFTGSYSAVTVFRISAKHPVTLETDGEILSGTDFAFSVLPKSINLLINP